MRLRSMGLEDWCVYHVCRFLTWRGYSVSVNVKVKDGSLYLDGTRMGLCMNTHVTGAGNSLDVHGVEIHL